jgi:hypothetical protein
MFQEANSVAKSTGTYTDLYVTVSARLNRPVSNEERKLMNEKRSTLAPCDNIAEITSPLVITMAIGMEAVFDGLPTGRAPYFAHIGTMGGWRSQRFHGEALIMMTIVFLVRVVFCYIEFAVRANQRRRDETRTSATDADISQPSPNNEEEAIGDNTPTNDEGTRAASKSRRRSSMAVLYHRIVRSNDAPVQMHYLTCALFVLQPIIFVPYATMIGNWFES